MADRTKNVEEKVYDAMLTLKAYCNIKKNCSECCINQNGYCQFRDGHNSPIHWDFPVVKRRR